jgi:hypothetical protein
MKAWRLAAVALIALCIGVAGALPLALIRPALALHALQSRALAQMNNWAAGNVIIRLRTTEVNC